MDHNFQFTFRNMPYSCTAVIDRSAEPYLVFAILTDPLLITEFGDEVTVKTDFVRLLPKRDDYPALIELRQSILNGLKLLPAFSETSSEIMHFGNRQKVVYGMKSCGQKTLRS